MSYHPLDAAHAIGEDAARGALRGVTDDAIRGRLVTLEDIDDTAFPQAFGEALEALPQWEAPDISAAVHEGIAEAFRAHLDD
jgi:hypothetical protein